MSILHTLTQLADTYAPLTNASVPSFSETASASSVPCRVEESDRQIAQSDGTKVTADALILTGPDVTVTRNYKIVIDGTSYIVDRIFPVRRLTTLDHYELTCRML